MEDLERPKKQFSTLEKVLMSILGLGMLPLFSVSGCKTYRLEGDQVAMIYPQHGIARVRTITNSCPLKVTEAREIVIQELDGWCAVPPDQCAKYTRDYETKACD